MDNLRPWDAALAVSARNVARPKTDVIESGLSFRAEKNNGMTVFASADFRRPEDFHEIAGLRLSEVVEVFAEIHFVEKPRRSRAIGIPSTPDAFAVALVPNEETVEGGVGKTEAAASTQRLDRFDEHQIRRAGAITRRRGIGDDGKNARLKMGGGLQSNGGGAGGGIFSAGWHRANLIEDEIVIFARRDLTDAEPSRAQENGEADDDSAQVPFQNYALTNRTRFR